MYKPENTLKPHKDGLRPCYASGNQCSFIGYFHKFSDGQRYGTYNATERRYEKIDNITVAICESESGEIVNLPLDMYQLCFLDTGK